MHRDVQRLLASCRLHGAPEPDPLHLLLHEKDDSTEPLFEWLLSVIEFAGTDDGLLNLAMSVIREWLVSKNELMSESITNLCNRLLDRCDRFDFVGLQSPSLLTCVDSIISVLSLIELVATTAQISQEMAYHLLLTLMRLLNGLCSLSKAPVYSAPSTSVSQVRSSIARIVRSLLSSFVSPLF